MGLLEFFVKLMMLFIGPILLIIGIYLYRKSKGINVKSIVGIICVGLGLWQIFSMIISFIL